MRIPRRLACTAVVLAVSSIGAFHPASAAPLAAGARTATVTTRTAAAAADTTTTTKFGVSLPFVAGKNAAESVAAYRTEFGALPAVRVFDNDVPAKWTDNATLRALGTSSDVIFSFQGNMAAIASGADDAKLTSFLASKPAGVKVWVVLHHEPEDDIERGMFTATQFRAATTHVAPVIRAAGGVPTTILMAWSLDPKSHRDWHDYYSPAVDVMAYDAYNTGQRKSTYKDPAKFVAPVLAVAAETGKAFGWAELGSPCISTDPTCAGRAAWLASLGTALGNSGAQFATYWNRASENSSLDFSLDDAASVAAWRSMTTR